MAATFICETKSYISYYINESSRIVGNTAVGQASGVQNLLWNVLAVQLGAD